MPFPPNPQPGQYHSEGTAVWRWQNNRWTGIGPAVPGPPGPDGPPGPAGPSGPPGIDGPGNLDAMTGASGTDTGLLVRGGNGLWSVAVQPAPDPGTDWPETETGQVRAFYIAANGSSAPGTPGTKAQPWSTVAQVNSFAKQPGDAFMFRAGDTFTGTIQGNVSGTSANPIFYRSYGLRSDRARIQAPTGTGAHCANVGNVGYNRFSNLILLGRNTSGTALSSVAEGSHAVLVYAVNALNTQFVGNRFVNLDISGAGGNAFRIWPRPATTSDTLSYVDLLIENCFIHDNADGIRSWTGGVSGAGIEVSYNIIGLRIRNCVCCRSTGASWHWQGGNGIVLSGCDDALVENCVAYGNGSNATVGTDGPCGMWCHDTKNTVFRFCEAYNNVAPSGVTDGGGFDIDGGAINCVFEYCYSHDNRGAGLQLWYYTQSGNASGNKYRFCVSENDVNDAGYNSASIHTGSSDQYAGYLDCTWHNCVVYQRHNKPIIMGGGAGGGYGFTTPCYFYNNIFVAAGASHFMWGATNRWQFNGNNYVGTATFNWQGTNYSTPAAWRTGSGQENLVSAIQTWAHGLNSAGNGGTVSSTAEPPTFPVITAAMFAGWMAYQLTSGSQNRGTATTISGLNLGPHDMFSNSLVPPLSIGAHSPHG